MKRSFHKGQRVYWWRRLDSELEYPYLATVLDVGNNRIRLAVEDPDSEPTILVKKVAVHRVQLVEVYYGKAENQAADILPPMDSWGSFTVYLEIGEDLFILRQVKIYENGNILSYDRTHWHDKFGMLGDARINRLRIKGCWGTSAEITSAEFERVWNKAKKSKWWKSQQLAKMMGKEKIPTWLRIKRWRPDPLSPKSSNS